MTFLGARYLIYLMTRIWKADLTSTSKMNANASQAKLSPNMEYSNMVLLMECIYLRDGLYKKIFRISYICYNITHTGIWVLATTTFHGTRYLVYNIARTWTTRMFWCTILLYTKYIIVLSPTHIIWGWVVCNAGRCADGCERIPQTQLLLNRCTLHYSPLQSNTFQWQ